MRDKNLVGEMVKGATEKLQGCPKWTIQKVLSKRMIK
jgi:hypothetical protein